MGRVPPGGPTLRMLAFPSRVPMRIHAPFRCNNPKSADFPAWGRSWRPDTPESPGFSYICPRSRNGVRSPARALPTNGIAGASAGIATWTRINKYREGMPKVGRVYREKEMIMATALLALTAKKRERSTKAALKNMRKEGRVPAVVYGLDKDPQMVEVSTVDMRAHLTQRNHVIELSLDGAASQKVMIKAIERDPISRNLMHIDFLRVDNEHPVIVNVPVTTFGIPFGVKTEGGVFSTMKKFVKLRAKVQDIPDKFDMDVSDLKSGIIFYVKDLKFEKGTFVTPGKTALYGVTTGKAEVEEVKPAAAAAAPAADAKKDGKTDAKADAKAGDKKDEKKK